MCDPVTGALIASTVVSAGGALYQGAAAKAQGKYQSQIAARNALLAEESARDAIARGAEDEQRVRREGGLFKGKQTARMGAGNLDMSFGSPLDAIIDTTVGVEMDALRVRRNAAREATDLDRGASNYRTQGRMDRMGASSAMTGAALSAGGAVLQGAAAVGKYRASIA